MPITSDTITVAQYRESEANVDLVTEITVNADARVLLTTPVGQNDNEMAQASFAQWMLATNVIGGGLTATPSASNIVIDNGTAQSATLDVVTPGGNAGLMSGDDKTKLDNSAGTNLTTSLTTTDATINSDTGTNALIPLANSSASNAGLMSAEQEQKSVTTVWVTDSQFAGGADPAGGSDAGTAIQAAIDYAVANRIGRVFFPRGVYLVNTQINFPTAENDPSYRLLIDLGGSRINSTADITIFNRSLAAPDTTKLLQFAVIIKDGYMNQDGTSVQGTAIHIENQQQLTIENVTFRRLSMVAMARLPSSLPLNFIQFRIANASSSLKQTTASGPPGVNNWLTTGAAS